MLVEHDLWVDGLKLKWFVKQFQSIDDDDDDVLMPFVSKVNSEPGRPNTRGERERDTEAKLLKRNFSFNIT